MVEGVSGHEARGGNTQVEVHVEARLRQGLEQKASHDVKTIRLRRAHSRGSTESLIL